MQYLVHHLLEFSATRSPGKEAVVHGDLRLTYDELQREVNRYVATLVKAGRTSNDRVGILLPPGIPLVSSIFSISAAGAVFVPIHHSSASKLATKRLFQRPTKFFATRIAREADSTQGCHLH